MISKKWKKLPSPRTETFHPRVLKYVYENTTEDSTLRTAILNICVHGMEAQTFARYISDYPREFLNDYAILQTQRADSGMPLYSKITSLEKESEDLLRMKDNRPPSPDFNTNPIKIESIAETKTATTAAMGTPSTVA